MCGEDLVRRRPYFDSLSLCMTIQDWYFATGVILTELAAWYYIFNIYPHSGKAILERTLLKYEFWFLHAMQALNVWYTTAVCNLI